MTAMDTDQTLTVGQVADRFGVTIRTLHHYDEIGLLRPQQRTAAGYRLYSSADLARLQNIVVYRRLGFPLEDVAVLLDDERADVGVHLRRQREAVTTRLDELTELVAAIDRALEAHMSGIQLSPEEQRELFGDEFAENFPDYQREAQERWGDTDAWRQSQERAARYTKDDWARLKIEMDEVNAAFVDAKRAGEPPTSPRATAAAEAHRRHIDGWHYALGYPMHRCLADMYVADERFAAHYDALEPGLAQYVRDAIHANADAREPTAGERLDPNSGRGRNLGA